MFIFCNCFLSAAPLTRFCPSRAELVAGAVDSAQLVNQFTLRNHVDSCSDGICNLTRTLFLAVHLAVFRFHGRGVGIVPFVASAVGTLSAIPATENMEQADET